MKNSKRWKNFSGDILVKESDASGIGIVEILHLYNKKNDAGCVIGCWKTRKCDGEIIAEFQSIHDRIMEVDYSDVNLIEILKFGQKLADIIIEINKK